MAVGASALVNITEIQPIKVSFALPQADLPRIQARAKMPGGLTAQVMLHEQGGTENLTAPIDFIGNIVKHLKKGERIRIGGLGILQVRRRAARMGRNPATGEAIQIKASKKVAFRASKELKESI